MGAKLISLAPSPYTRKARWALECCHPDFEVVSFTALFGEPWLRWKLGCWRGKLTLPVMLLPSGGALRDSYDIAVWGNEHRAQDAPNLFPDVHKQAIQEWNEKSEILLGYFRIAAITGAKQDPAALSPLLPPFTRGLGPLTTFFCSQLISTVESKYRDMAGSKEQALALLRELSAAVQAGGGRHLAGGALTYADIAMAVPLKLMVPVGPAYNSLGSFPGSFMEVPGLLGNFPDLVAWRDAVYRDFFPAAKP